MSALRTLIDLGGLLVAIGSLAVSICREENSGSRCCCAERNVMPTPVAVVEERTAMENASPSADRTWIVPDLPGPRFFDSSRDSSSASTTTQGDASRLRLRQLFDEMAGASP